MTGLGQVPAEWEFGALRGLTTSIRKTDPITTGRASVRYIDIGSVDGCSHSVGDVAIIDSKGAPSRARQMVQAGDTLFSTVRPYLEKIAFVDGRLDGEFASTGFSVLRPGPKLLPRFLFYYSISPMMLDQVVRRQKGVSYPAVLDREVRDTLIPVPPLEEQRRIVELLEDHLSRLEAAGRQLDTAGRRIAKLAQASAAAITVAAEADKATHLVRLSDISQIGSGCTPRRGDNRYWENGSVPWITSADLAQGRICEARQFVTETALVETAIRLWPAGTLLVAMYGEGKTRGTVGELAIEASVNQACAAINLGPLPNATRAWVRLVLESRYETMRSESSGGVQPNLTLRHFKAMELPMPTEAVAAPLMARHQATVEAARRLSEGIHAAQRRSNALRRALLAAAFSGRLTRAASDTAREAGDIEANQNGLVG